MGSISRIVDPNDLRSLAGALPDTPETVISLHQIRRGLCRAYVSGPIDNPTALVVDGDSAPGEPSCYGDNPEAIWHLLRDLPGWFAPNMREEVAPLIGANIERERGEPVRYLGDLHFTLQRPALERSHPNIRLLGPDDQAILDAAPVEVRGGGFGTTSAMLLDGIAAGAIVENRLVSIAHTSAMTDRHADIGVSTLAEYRGRGYATTAASLVAYGIQQTGRTPVWSCGETNAASLRVARNLGFEPVLRRVYVIVDSHRT